MQRVLIVGGGTGGTMLANRLDKHRFAVTLVSASAEHMFQPDLLYVATANLQRDILREERRLLARGVRFVNEKVTRVNLETSLVETEPGSHYEYDRLVLATGVHTVPSQIPGLSEVNERFGDYHSSVAQAKKLWSCLDAFSGGTIVLGQSSPICVCPPSPVEGILQIDRLLRQRGLREKSRLVFFTPYPARLSGRADRRDRRANLQGARHRNPHLLRCRSYRHGGAQDRVHRGRRDHL